ncbi:MAG: hypothetical protein JWQ50_822 [Caballeronia mineralivorans]|nr:hypothetical protein [Caballeronia mineralivorans]
MVQALLEKHRRGSGVLIQFGSGPDGSREATWEQQTDHPTYTRPPGAAEGKSAMWVFQAKFHDIGQRGWRGAGEAVISDLKKELEKLTSKHQVPCDHFVLITNVPLSGVRRLGTRDQVTAIADEWKAKIPIIEVWDAVDLSRMLDNSPEVRTAYLDLILPGDVIAAIYRQVQFASDRRESAFSGYLQYLIDNESKARADEAGDEEKLPLNKVFIDQDLTLDRERIPEAYRDIVDSWASDPFNANIKNSIIPDDLDCVTSSFVLLLAAHEKVMLLAGPGYGKSTITQFLALYHASRLVKRDLAEILAKRLKLPKGVTAESLDAFCTMRFPFRIELRRYAKWRSNQTTGGEPIGLAKYIARELIGANVESALTADDIFQLANANPLLLILDGLDEVPNKESRDNILKDCDAFIYRCMGEKADVQVVMSSRPQGYNGEFDRFEPLRWTINDLSKSNFDEYCHVWISERIKSAEERGEAEERISRGMKSDAVRRLATTLLQATVMLTIVRRKSDIPEERHRLFHKYVEVVFQREKAKNELISRYEPELMHLHELVGYRLHEAVGRGAAAMIPETDFKAYVREVWHLVRGDQPSEIAPNAQCNAIMQMTTDRLVFLSGKGDSQADVDFVIQPYREYFAAEYLHLHAMADPDRVFTALVERGAFWANVLQFYAAVATPAQQIAWVFGRTSDDPNSSKVDSLVRRVKRHRAILATLPEYTRFGIAQFRAAIGAAFPMRTWWTWISQEWAAPIMRTARAGQGWRELFTILSGAQEMEIGAAEFALWFFPQVITEADSEYQPMLQLVRGFLKDGRLSTLAVDAILIHELEIVLTIEHEREIMEAWRGSIAYRRRIHDRNVRSRSFNPFSIDLMLRMVASDQGRYYRTEDSEDPWLLLSLPVGMIPSGALNRTQASNVSITASAPQWTLMRTGDEGGLGTINGNIHNTDVYRKYFVSLYCALQDQADSQRDIYARQCEQELPMRVAWNYRAVAVLGPPARDFTDSQSWLRYKAGVRQLVGEAVQLGELQAVLSTFGSQHSKAWVLFLFKPKYWNLVVAAGLVSEVEVNQFRESRWGILMDIPYRIAEVQDLVDYVSVGDDRHDVPLCAILKIAVQVHNVGGLATSNLVPHMYEVGEESNPALELLREAVEALKDPQGFPEDWARLLFRHALANNAVDERAAAKLWWGFSRAYKNQCGSTCPG